MLIREKSQYPSNKLFIEKDLAIVFKRNNLNERPYHLQVDTLLLSGDYPKYYD